MKIQLLKIIFFLTPLFFFSQKKLMDTVYIQFNSVKDKHYEKKKEINFFEICIDNNRYVHFQYGISNIRTFKTFNKTFVDRNSLSNIIKNDNGNKEIFYIIVKKIANNNYKLYQVDHIFRTIVD